VRAALRGETDCMVSLVEDGVRTTPLSEIAGIERAFPLEWIAENGHDVTREFLDYARPFIGRMERHISL